METTDMPSDSAGQTEALLATLRRSLKRNALTIASLAERLAVSEATVKRWLAGKGLTLDRLEQLAALAGLNFAELAQESATLPDHLSGELTCAQERALSDDELMAFVFIVILGGYDWHEILVDFAISAAVMESILERLEKLALIDRLSSGRVRPRIDRNIIWRKAPMRAQFEARMKAQFLAMDFSQPEAVYASAIYKLSEQGAAMLAELIERHRREISALADLDRKTARLPRSWHTVLTAARPLDTTGLRQS
jgi:transcriptional regulator with XRE-family HTH domain